MDGDWPPPVIIYILPLYNNKIRHSDNNNALHFTHEEPCPLLLDMIYSLFIFILVYNLVVYQSIDKGRSKDGETV